MTTVRKILESKTGAVWSVAPDMPLVDALRLMADKKVGALLVRENDRIVGIFTERDFARHIIQVESPSAQTPVRQLMIERVYVISPEEPLEQCIALMVEKQFRHLPVMENNQVIGMVSIRDVVKQAIEEKDNVIQNLEDYIWQKPG